MEITIAAHGGQLFPQSESTSAKEYEEVDYDDSEYESLVVEISECQKKMTRETWKTRPTLKELEKKKYPFPDSDLAGMLDDLFEKKLIKLPECKRPNEEELTSEPKYCRYHQIVSHPLEKCITLKEEIMRLVDDGKILLDGDDVAECNYTATQMEVVKRPSLKNERVQLIELDSLERVNCSSEKSSSTPFSTLLRQMQENDEQGRTLVTRHKSNKQNDRVSKTRPRRIVKEKTTTSFNKKKSRFSTAGTDQKRQRQMLLSRRHVFP